MEKETPPPVDVRRNPAHVLNRSETAAYLNISPRTLEYLTQQKKIKSRKLGRRRIYLLKELEEFLNNLPA